jgi:hypothetical protein
MDALMELIERDEENGEALYVHSEGCPSFCDYACNGESGLELAKIINDLERPKGIHAAVDAIIGILGEFESESYRQICPKCKLLVGEHLAAMGNEIKKRLGEMRNEQVRKDQS